MRAQDDDATPVPKRHHHKQPADATADESSTPAAKKKSSSKKVGFQPEAASATPEETPAPKSHRHKKPAADESPTPAKKKSKKAVSPEASPTPEETPAKTKGAAGAAPDATLSTDELVEFKKQPVKVRKLLVAALELTTRNLTYTYGSAEPENGGMDCSGFIYYILKQNGFDDVPRSASGQYVWLRKAGLFQAVLSGKSDTFELDALRPGDILFWTGTYAVDHDPPVTHTMLYLGRKGKKRVMVGASDGRSFEGATRWGVSVFDFKVPPATAASPDGKTHPVFVGYAHLPGLGEP